MRLNPNCTDSWVPESRRKVKRPVFLGWRVVCAGATIFLASCAGFRAAGGAAVGRYQPPRDHLSPEFLGMMSPRQAEHLREGIFPVLGDEERRLITIVNRRVNEKISYLSDWDNYGVPDFHAVNPVERKPHSPWVVRGVYGDCEDYALSKKEELIKGGVDPSRLFVAKAVTGDRWEVSPHCVLLVPEGREWWVMDNSDNRIEPASYLRRWWGWKFPELDTPAGGGECLLRRVPPRRPRRRGRNLRGAVSRLWKKTEMHGKILTGAAEDIRRRFLIRGKI